MNIAITKSGNFYRIEVTHLDAKPEDKPLYVMTIPSSWDLGGAVKQCVYQCSPFFPEG